MNPVEIMAAAIAPMLGPLEFDELPADRAEMRQWQRAGRSECMDNKDDFTEAAQAALTALQAQGYAVVPVEASEGMLGVADNYMDNYIIDAEHLWALMIAAATAEREVGA